MFRIVGAAEAPRAQRCPRRSPRTSVTPALSIATSVPGAHRDADVGLRERRRVVHPVAGHRDDAALGLELAHRRRPSARAARRPPPRRARAASPRPRPSFGCRRSASRPAAPRRAGRRSRPGVDSLIGSATPTSPARRPVDGERTSRSAPRRACGRPSASRLATPAPSSSINLRLPIPTPRSPLRPTTPRPVRESKSRHLDAPDAALVRARDDRPGERVLARALERRRRDASSSSSSKPSAATTATSRGLPSVSVPVLSTTSGVDIAQQLDRLGVAEQHAGRRGASRSRP